MKLSAKSILFASCSLLALSACGGATGIKENLGLSHKSPDEFRVVSRPPLSVPPQFNLRPPSNSTESPTVVAADKQAQSIITGTPVKGDDNSFDLRDNAVDTAVTPVETIPLPSGKGDKPAKNAPVAKASSQSSFMKNIGADKADPKVRNTLVEQKIIAEEKQDEASWWNFWSTQPEKKEPLVNAKGEADRLKTNKAANKPVTAGDTPEVKDKDHGLLGNVFGW